MARWQTYQAKDEELVRARTESGREWLPILNEQRALLRDYQLRVLDNVAACLANVSSPLISPDTSTWTRSPALRINVTLVDQDGLAVESWLRVPARRFIKVGRIDPSDYDQDWRTTPEGSEDLREVVFMPSQLDEALAKALGWIEAEISGSSG